MRKNHALFPFGMGILALICFLGGVWMMAMSVQPLWGRTMVLLLPAILLFAVAAFSQTGVLSRRLTVIITSLLSAVLLMGSFFYVVLLSVWSATTVTTDIQYYSSAFSKIANEEGVDGVFTSEIPEDVEDVVFHYNPQFLQGGEVFELSYATTDENITEWEFKLEQKASWIGSNEEWHRLNSWSFREEDSTRYHLYWDGGYNHGEMSYVLIDPSSNRITFFYTDW